MMERVSRHRTHRSENVKRQATWLSRAGVVTVVLPVLAALLLAAAPASGRRMIVAHAPASGRPDLASALLEAAKGDTLVLSPGRYSGPWELADGVSILGAAGPDSTLLDAGGAGYVLRAAGIGEDVVISGLTIRSDAGETDGGGGILLTGSSPRITNNVFFGHHASTGAAICAEERSDPIIAFNVFHDNRADTGGAIAATDDSAPLIYNNLIYDNVAQTGGGVACIGSSPMIMRNTIYSNRAGEPGGGAVYLDASAALISGNVMAENQGMGAVYCADVSRASMRCNLLWKNSRGSAAGSCEDFVGVNLNREGNPGFVSPEDRVLWRRYAGDENKPCYEAAGASSWNPLDPPEVPESIITFWRLRRARG
jgi:hypothetical protein